MIRRKNGSARLIGDFAQCLKKVNKINTFMVVQLCKCTCLHMRTACSETLMFTGLCSCAVVHFYKKGNEWVCKPTSPPPLSPLIIEKIKIKKEIKYAY
ncbi:MAG: hypothetical protein CMG35_10115 [Candidatus Marinimicrobia bacterium]|nr:hypothetical protein [Candidatus Neomarinimicrobiota bacterium]